MLLHMNVQDWLFNNINDVHMTQHGRKVDLHRDYLEQFSVHDIVV